LDREAERRLKNNRARTARRHRAAAHARERAPATLTAPKVLRTPDEHDVPAADTRQVLLLGSTQADPPTTSPPECKYSPCARCLHCTCRQPKNYSAAQRTSRSPARRSRASRRRSSSSRQGQRRPPRTPSTGPPLLWREAQQAEGPTDGPDTLSWDDAQAQYSQGAEAMSQGSEGSPFLFLDPAACDYILADLRGEDGRLPTFSDSEPGTPPPTLEAEESHGERATQTSPVPTHDQSTSAVGAEPHLPLLHSTRLHTSCSGPHARWPTRRWPPRPGAPGHLGRMSPVNPLRTSAPTRRPSLLRQRNAKRGAILTMSSSGLEPLVPSSSGHIHMQCSTSSCRRIPRSI